MLFKKLWRTMLQYKAQFISMIIMITLGVGMFVGFNTEWYSIDRDTGAFFKETGYADYRIIYEKGFSADDLDKISSVDGVTAAARFLSVNADVKDFDGDTVALTVTTDEKVSGMYLESGDEYDARSEDGIWLSKLYAEANGVSVGDSLTLKYKNLEISGEVKGLIRSGEYLVCVRDETQLMPDYDTHGFAYISPVMYEKAVGADFYPQINVLAELDKTDFIDTVDSVLGRTSLVLSKDESSSYAAASGESDEGKSMGAILPTMFLLIAVLTMVTTMHRLAVKEKTQIGTLKALGFKNRRILRHYSSYAFMIGVVASVFGTGLGYLVAGMIFSEKGSMGTYFDMPDWTLVIPKFCVWTVILMIALLTFIGFLSVKAQLRGTAADALRPAVPKKMKPMLIERTKSFHKLPFGTRWNMRDIMRHRSRTAMSLIGIIGCMILLVGSLGMRDTMSDFLDTFYDGATKYSSRIYLAEDASDSDRSRIKELYSGDTSASVSVQLKEKAVSLDIFDIENGLVRFPDKKDGFIELSNDGALICSRIADEFGLKKGDKFEISPYGSDKKYTLTVADVMRSTSESVAINTEYASSLKLGYTPDSVYTSVEKADIGDDAAIKSVQSKQMIIDSFDSFLEIMNMMIALLIVGALVLATVVLYNLGVMSMTERYREMATLKVVGFRDKKIGKLLIDQNLWLSIIGIILGIPAGYGTLAVLEKELASEYELKTTVGLLSILISVALTLGVSLAVSYAIAKKNRKIDMVEALKGAE